MDVIKVMIAIILTTQKVLAKMWNWSLWLKARNSVKEFQKPISDWGRKFVLGNRGLFRNGSILTFFMLVATGTKIYHFYVALTMLC